MTVTSVFLSGPCSKVSSHTVRAALSTFCNSEIQVLNVCKCSVWGIGGHIGFQHQIAHGALEYRVSGIKQYIGYRALGTTFIGCCGAGETAHRVPWGKRECVTLGGGGGRKRECVTLGGVAQEGVCNGGGGGGPARGSV